MPARKFAPINWIQWLSLFTAVSLAILMVFNVIRIDNAHRETNDSIKTVLCYFEQRTLSNPLLTDEQKHQAIRLYADALQQINEQPC